MKTRTWKTSTSLFPVIGLLVLAGICSEGRDTLAQSPDACSLPAGVAPPPDPAVTAQQVEDGSATLMDFALAARDYQREVTTAATPYLGCYLRQEGSPWRSGSTYFVELTPDGRIFLHTKDMSLSGHQLRPEIYAEILSALGVPPTVLANLVSPDPDAAAQAGAALFDILSQEPHAPFDATAPVPGLRPGIPGASGYAVVSVHVSGIPIVVLSGFDVDESHLADEVIDYGDPTLTAEEVVDRTTLKEFVTQAGEFLADLLEIGDLAAMSKARLALRDPDGPWRHGPVYLAVLQPGTGLIMFHGAFPDRFELRQGGIARDVATGELVVDQLVAAAESGPEGGYWLYHFDNPADDTDSADIPKVGYARVITSNVPLPDGSTVPTDFIVNSGFYLTSDGEFVRRLLEALDDGQTSIMFDIAAPGDGEVVAGDAVAVSVTGAPTDTVHFAYRLAGLPEGAYTYLGAATNREGIASFAWDTLDVRDDDYELVALYTEDEGESVIHDTIEVSVDNVGDGGCVAMPALPGGPVDPTLPGLVGILMVYLLFGRRRRSVRQAALG